MTQLEELANKIETQRRNLQNLINNKRNLVDFEIVEASQNLDQHLNLYHYSLKDSNCY